MLNTITNIDRDSPARGKVKVGDELLSINGHGVEDVLDYRYWSYEPRLSLVLRSGETGREYTVKIRKDAGEDLGLDFEESLMDKPWGCSNRCLFCFIDQLPRGLRRTLYFKDDDARLSFLTGSYITLTNLSEREMERICALKISPINVSVHATDPELRAKLMGNPKAADIMGPLRRLTAAGITVDCQIVCCPGYNDKEQLSRSMRELSELYPGVNSVSIVPVGLTKHRQGLAELTPFDKDSASETIDRVEKYAAECLEKHGQPHLLVLGRALPQGRARGAGGRILRGIQPAGKRRWPHAPPGDGVHGCAGLRGAGRGLRLGVHHCHGRLGSAAAGKTFTDWT